jgi:hypothetical protein
MSISVEVDARARDRRVRPMGSSLRHRRLVLGGYVLFDPVALARPSMRPMEIELLRSLFAKPTMRWSSAPAAARR